MTALWRLNLVDQLAWFRAPSVLGDDAMAGLGDLGIGSLADARRLRRLTVQPLADDILETYAIEAL